jgi:hypothetical protein
MDQGNTSTVRRVLLLQSRRNVYFSTVANPQSKEQHFPHKDSTIPNKRLNHVTLLENDQILLPAALITTHIFCKSDGIFSNLKPTLRNHD